MSKKKGPKKSFKAESEVKSVPEEKYMALQLIIAIDDDFNRDEFEDAVMDLACNCQGKEDVACRLQTMGGVTGTFDQCMDWMDPGWTEWLAEQDSDEDD